ncbi:MAG TPA: N-acetylmuramic acid 6-phosphate etherase [Methylomirabilota bacterium]|jgi:N-acetylmuramic acid 6-phosphate etherase|nr:N-acetylmuramic acid 6-phosphate etherase [Methylomirabilota bacterium]
MTTHPRVRYDRLPTERSDPRSRELDRLSPIGIARLMNRADQEAVRAVARAAPAIARTVELIVQALSAQGRLIFVGAGTSGRLGVLEAAECPPTFGTSSELVQAVIAGGRRAVSRSAEGAEDDAAEGARQMGRRVRRGDVVIGIAASGVTPFVRGALDTARRRRAMTVLVTCNPRVSRRAARVVIPLVVGPEVLAGSTRLKAGTATKLTLNTLTTAAFARLGKVYGNRMVDLRPRSAKLRARARRLVSEIGGVGQAEATRLLEAAGGSAKLAIVMARLEVPAGEARQRLKAAKGSLAGLLGGTVCSRASGSGPRR